MLPTARALTVLSVLGAAVVACQVKVEGEGRACASSVDCAGGLVCTNAVCMPLDESDAGDAGPPDDAGELGDAGDGGPQIDGGCTVFYVDDVAGSDTANGLTPATAWASVARVNQVADWGGCARVLFRPTGAWTDPLAPQGTGVTFSTYDGGFATLNGHGQAKAGISFDNSVSAMTVENFIVTNWAATGTTQGLVYVGVAQNITLDRLVLTDGGNCGLYVGKAGAQNISLTNSTIVNVNNTGVAIEAAVPGVVVQNTAVQNVAFLADGGGGHCVEDKGVSAQFKQMTLVNCPKWGFHLSGQGTQIVGNTLSNTTPACIRGEPPFGSGLIEGNQLGYGDGGCGSYGMNLSGATGSLAAPLVIKRNKFWQAVAADITLDGSSYGPLYVSNNTFLASSDAGVGLFWSPDAGGTKLAFQNNIVRGNFLHPFSVSGVTSYTEDHNYLDMTNGQTLRYNVANYAYAALSSYQSASGGGGQDLFMGDPGFTGETAFPPDFSLTASAAVISAGTASPVSGALSPDAGAGYDAYCGAAPDMGALERCP